MNEDDRSKTWEALTKALFSGEGEGMEYKKTYWDAEKEVVTSKPVSATDIYRPEHWARSTPK